MHPPPNRSLSLSGRLPVSARSRTSLQCYARAWPSPPTQGLERGSVSRGIAPRRKQRLPAVLSRMWSVMRSPDLWPAAAYALAKLAPLRCLGIRHLWQQVNGAASSSSIADGAIGSLVTRTGIPVLRGFLNCLQDVRFVVNDQHGLGRQEGLSQTPATRAVWLAGLRHCAHGAARRWSARWGGSGESRRSGGHEPSLVGARLCVPRHRA